jgi:transcription elongation factor GreA
MATLQQPDPYPLLDGGAPPRRLLTADGARMLSGEIDRLRAEKDEQVARRLREARQAGSWGDGDEYLAIKEEEAILAARIASLEEFVHHATLIDDSPAEDGLVGIGSVVDVEDVASGRRMRYELVGWHDGAQPGTASAGSPVGQALLGQPVGSTVDVELPDGRTRELRIVAVEGALGEGP